MNSYEIKVYFASGRISYKIGTLIAGDYNSSKFNFNFDDDSGVKMFELLKPDGITKWVKEIVNNEVILVDTDELGENIPLLTQSGTYIFEISKYDGDSKLTSVKGKFKVIDEQINNNTIPIDEVGKTELDDLINDVAKVLEEGNTANQTTREQAEYAKQQGDYAKQQAQTVNQANENAINIINTFESNVNKYTSSFNANAESKTESYDKNAETKLEDYNTNHTNKVKIYNDNHNSKVESYNENADKKAKSFDDNVTTKTETFNQNAENKTIAYNQNHNAKLKEYNENSTKKQTDFNTNVSNKLTEYNNNAIAKLEEYNTNHNTKSEEYNANAESKVNEFNLTVDHIEDSVDEAYDNQIIGSAESESIYLKDSANARLRVLNIDGNFKQETTTGQQLFDISTLKDSYSINGIDFTVDKDKGTITANGTATADTSLVLISDDANYKTGETYNFSGCPAGGSANTYRLWLSDKIVSSESEFGEGNVYTLQNDAIYFRMFFKAGTTANNLIFKPMLAYGPDVLPYEKYTGGQASPSPNYPQKIEVDEGIENLFDKDNVNEVNGIPSDNSKTFVASSSAKSFYIPCTSKERYVVSRKIVGSRFTVGTTENLPVDGEPIIDIIVANNSRTITIDTSSNAKFLVVYYLYNSSEDENEILSSIQIEKRKTHHNYVPFGRWKKIRIMGKNFCNLGNEVAEKIGVEVEYNYNELKINGTTTSGGNITTIRDNINYDGNRLIGTFPAGTYTYTSKLISGSFSRVEGGTFAFYIRNESNESLFSYGGHFDTIKKFTLTETTALYLQFYSNNENVGGTFDDCVVKIQIEPEETSTDCEPYVENELLINLKGNFIGKTNNDIKDKLKISLDLDDKKIHAKLSKKVSKAVFDGSENWSKSNTSGTITSFFITKNDVKLNSEIKSDHFKYYQMGYILSAKEVGITIHESVNRIYIALDGVNDVDTLKTLLSNNPVTVYYELAEPYEIDLGVVQMPKTYANISNITLISNMDTNMQVEYVKHTKTVIDNLQSQIDAINTLLNTTATSAMLLDNYENDLESEVMS